MMRKLLILMLVLGMASMANAALTILVDGVDVGNEITIASSETIWIGIHDDTGGTQYGAAVIIADDVDSQANGAWTGGNNYYAPPATPGGGNAYYGYFSGGIGDVWYLVDQAATTSMPTAGLQGDYEFHCVAPGDVLIKLTDYGLTNALDTITIHQIPEPVTLALLGLGGLLLRRRK
jgi:hypothetical protein